MIGARPKRLRQSAFWSEEASIPETQTVPVVGAFPDSQFLVHPAAEAPFPLNTDGGNRDMWLYRERTVALLRRYSRISIEVGRLPSILGRELFRSKVTSYRMSSFEDGVISCTTLSRRSINCNYSSGR